MNFIKKNIEKAYNFLLSQSFRVKSERAILAVAISSYIAHLILILLVNQEIIKLESNFFTSPIAAIYTPFSFILIYEVYLLIFFLPKSISFYIGKQYEIIMLIVIRKIFKDISNIKMSSDWFFIKSDLQFTYDVVTSLIVFLLIFLFYKNIINKNDSISEANSIKLKSIKKFISFKKTLAVLLVPALFILSLYTFINWVVLSFEDYKYGILEFKNINRIFFAIGACCASFVWFFGIAFGAKLLTPIIQKPSHWRILDFLIALVMFAIAINLAYQGTWFQ